MCNLYSATTNVEALIQLVQTFNRPNLPELGKIYPKYEAPIIRPTAEGNELAMMAWGVPFAPSGQKPRPITNVRNTASTFWRSMLKEPARRCLVPATAFAEWTAEPDPPNEIVAPIHPKAMPVTLDPADYDRWLTTDLEGTCALHKPFSAERMREVEEAA